jgi:hypothetical protein
MFSALSSTAGAVFSFVSGFIPRPLVERASQVTEVALNAVSFLASSSSSVETGLLRTPKSLTFYQEFKQKTENPYKKEDLLKGLRAKPKVSKACLISDYLSLLAPTKVTHKIYDKLKSKWGYRQFYRTNDTGAKGLASAFIMHILLEDSALPKGSIHDRLFAFNQSILQSKKYPALLDPLKTMNEAFLNGHSLIQGITASEPCLFLDTLADVLVLNFYEKAGFTEELSFQHFVDSQSQIALKTSIQATLKLLDESPTALLVPLIGPKQSIFGHSPLPKFTFVIEHLATVLQQVKINLKAHMDTPALIEWIDKVEPLNLLTAFELDPLAIAKKDSLKPKMLEIFKAELIKLFTPNASLFLEGFSFSKRASHATHFESLADELTALEGAYLKKLTTIPLSKLFEIATLLEDFEDELLQRQTRFINHLSDLFNVSFVVHSWQISQQDKKRLKIQHIGKWHGPTCHIVLFPENNTSRVDLLKNHSVYIGRSELSDLISSSAFKRFKRHGSETLASITQESSSSSAADKLLAKHFLYYRLHIFACLHKLLHQKLPLLKDEETFDLLGNKEDDPALYNPFGREHEDLLPDFHTVVESKIFRIEKHLAGLNREIAELSYMTDSVFSHTKHQEIISEIQLLLKASKSATFQFNLKKIPDFLTGFTEIIRSLETEGAKLFTVFKTRSAEFEASNPAEQSKFLRIFSKTSFLEIEPQELISLIPRLHIDYSPPEVFGDFVKLKKLIESYKDAEMINVEALEAELMDLFAEVKKDQARFLAFYPTSQVAFTAVYDHPRPLELTSAQVNALIPKEKLSHPEIQKIVSLMVQFSNKLARRKFAKTTLSTDSQAAMSALIGTIGSKRAQFIAVNPLKAEAFDRLCHEAAPWNFDKVELSDLRLIPKGAHEDAKIMVDLKSFLKLIQKLKSYRKEKVKLEEKFSAFRGKMTAGFSEIDLFDNEEELFPEAGSLGSYEGETASLGGASYSSELRSVGSVERFITSLLL